MYIALFKDGRYSKAKVEDGHLARYDNSVEKFAEVYDIWSKTWYNIALTEELLESFGIPNLGYNKTNTGFEVYDITKEEYTEEILPVYVDVFGSIKKSKKNIALKTPTKEAVEASKVIYEKIENELIKLKHEADITTIREMIEKGNGIAYINARTNCVHDLFNVLYVEGIKILFSSNYNYIIGKIAKKSVLDLYVPESLVPMVIGKGGQTIKKIGAEIGAKRINVKPM